MYVIGDACGVQTKETTRTDGGGHYGRFLFEFHQKWCGLRCSSPKSKGGSLVAGGHDRHRASRVREAGCNAVDLQSAVKSLKM
jgi:hypothetical protein